MKKYDHSKIEKKWQKEWAEKKIYKTEEKDKPKFYVLDMFPYPSGEGLHVGHPKGYIATDAVSRMKRMQGYSVLHPMGFDAFGLPAENYAIKTKTNPAVGVAKNVARYKKQLEIIGFDYDWSREINTTDPKYYKWTQWIFLKLLEKGLAYESFEPINWCPSCKTGLANEDVEDGRCERCGTPVEKRPMRQWVLKITDYADRLLKDLELLDWPESIKEAQRNWIGRSEGAELDFPVSFGKDKPNILILHGYTGRNDKNFIPWLKEKLEKAGYVVEAPLLPDTNNPTEEGQVGYVLKNCRIDSNTIIIGHSLGGTVAMKALIKHGKSVKALILVAPAKTPAWKTEDQPFHKTFSWDIDYDSLKKLAPRRVVLSDLREADRVEYLKDLSRRLNAQLISETSEREHFCAKEEPVILKNILPSIKVFTTRPDTLFGVTYVVLAPEHELVTELLKHKENIKNRDEVLKYVTHARMETSIERTDAKKDKTGVKLGGVLAVNPVNKEEVPVYIADYVLADYGTGAVMAVPANDERDFAFAKKYGLPIKEVIEPLYKKTGYEDAVRENEPFKRRHAAVAVIKHWSEDKYLCLKWKKTDWRGFVIGGIEGNESPEATARREIVEETGYKSPKFVRSLGGIIHAQFYHAVKNENRWAHFHPVLFKLENGDKEDLAPEEKQIHDLVWVSPGEMVKFLSWVGDMQHIWRRVGSSDEAYTGEGILVNSGKFAESNSAEIKKDITEFAGGKWVVRYKLKDWVFSRQRYWGEPIPVLHDDGKIVPVAEKDLPVTLPKVKYFNPTGTGESPLANISKWVNVKEGSGKNAKILKRETNTMPQWAGSSWYYLRYMDPENGKALVGNDKEKYWKNVDYYVGGAEHATRHLIYARFWHKFLFDMEVVSEREPFKKLQSVGLIMGEDGRKMSKRFGNVVNPDEIVKTYGADTLRLYEMFMGPFDQAIAWSTRGMIGSRRFLERVWKLREKVLAKSLLSKEAETLLHKTIKKVTEDISSIRHNTAVSSLMILSNALEKETAIPREAFEIFLKLLAPLAPHIAEELWRDLGNETSIHISDWPMTDESKLSEESVTIAVQINGKVRANFAAAKGTPRQKLESTALKHENVKKWLLGKTPKKMIVVPDKLVSIVL